MYLFIEKKVVLFLERSHSVESTSCLFLLAFCIWENV